MKRGGTGERDGYTERDAPVIMQVISGSPWCVVSAVGCRDAKARRGSRFEETQHD